MIERLNKVVAEAVVILLCLVFFAGGCTSGPKMLDIPKMGFSMELPAGWQRGKIRLHRKYKYKADSEGRHCFKSETASHPYCMVNSFKLSSDWSSLSQYLNTPPAGLHGKAVSETATTICGFEAIEIVGIGFGAKMVPVKGLHVYIQKGSAIVVASFWSTTEDYDTYESDFRSAVDSITIQ